MEAIPEPAILHGTDADYSPHHVKLGRMIRGRIEPYKYERMNTLSAAALARANDVSMRVAYATLAMLAANRYINRLRGLKPYRVTWDARHGHSRAAG